MLYAPDRDDGVMLLMDLDRIVLPVRSITRPVLESMVLPELSIILVRGDDTVLRLPTEELLPETDVRVSVPDDLPAKRAEVEEVLFAELVL